MSAQAYTYATTKDTGNTSLQFTLYVIANNCNNATGRTFASIKSLMRETKTKSDRTMRNYVKRLIDAGFLARHKRKRDNGGNTSDDLELVGYLDWLAGIETPVQPARITGGVSPSKKPMQPARITGGPGSIPTGGIYLASIKKAENNRETAGNTTPVVSADTRRSVELMGVDLEELLAEMARKRERIRNPNSWLIAAAKRKASQTLGVSEAVVARMGSSDMKTRAQAMVAAVVASTSPRPHTARPSAALLASLGRAA